MAKNWAVFWSISWIIYSMISLSSAVHSTSDNVKEHAADFAKILTVCKKIESSISSASQVFYPPDPKYFEGISHYATTSSMHSVCSVEPGTTGDVATIMKTIREHRVPFGIKSGGHMMNPGFSSTTGIQIVMRRFRKVTFHANNQTVDVGTGLFWEDVYRALEPNHVNVVGARHDIGVGGFILGGGYSWKSNKYGLGCDNVFEYELVAPNGTIVYVNSKSYPDIFFALKGGFNNFGIVTNFNMRAVPQTEVYGGQLIYKPAQFEKVLKAVANFQTKNKDPKAQIFCSFIVEKRQISFNVMAFYDAPKAPDSTFKEFTDIIPTGTLKTQSFLAFFHATPVYPMENMRGRMNTVSVNNLKIDLLEQIQKQAEHFSSTLGSKPGAFFMFNIVSFLPIYKKSQDSAYPHSSSATPFFPIHFQFGWESPSDDDLFINGIKEAAKKIHFTAFGEDRDENGMKHILYPNYAMENTSPAWMYGENLPRLQSIRKAWDPENVMYLCGGFKF